jgi:hypothetical protein
MTRAVLCGAIARERVIYYRLASPFAFEKKGRASRLQWEDEAEEEEGRRDNKGPKQARIRGGKR